FQFVEDHKTEYSVKRMRTVLKLTRSSFYTWKATQARHTSRIYADGVLRARIAAVFAEEDELYGTQRITA
ncbi:IS3 family transposase, partial [Corynebacterium belfantii]|nr:IS3 family transposase [Corynebacterium belfantii]